MPAIDIQVALQGGGAKIYALIAAMEELHRAAEDGKIRITRIAGTSAGAIVGSLYAAGIDPLTMRTSFAALPLEGILGLADRPSFIAQMRLARRVLKGRPLANDKPISDLLEELFDRKLNLGRRARLKDLPIPLLLAAADVSQRERIVYDSTHEGEKDVVACVMDSCAIPFFFRGPGQGSQTLVLDGGLAENLPTDLLGSEVAKYGRVVAISFLDSTRSTPQTTLALAAALLDTAISSSVARAKTTGNISVIELNPYGVGTFDFRQAQNILRIRSGEYDNARLRTRDFISELVSSRGRVVSNTRWESSDPVTMDQILRIHRQQQGPRKFKHYSVRLRLVANSLLQEGDEDFGTRDIIEKTLEFAPTRESIDSILERIIIDGDEKPSNVYSEVFDPQGAPVPYQPLPVKALNQPEYGLLLFFTPPLVPRGDGKYLMRVAFRVPRLFPGLVAGGGGEPELMSTSVPRADGTADQVELILSVPSNFRPLKFADKPGSQPTEPIPARELPANPGFKALGWKAKEVPQGGSIGVEIRFAAQGV